MKESSDKIQSEFEQKLRQGQTENRTDNSISSNPNSLASESAGAPDTAKRNIPAGQQSKMIPVVEEQVRIDKKTVETGRVHISKDVHEEEITVDVPTVHEEVSVERVTINEYVDTPPAVRQEGDMMIIPVLKEELVVVKRLKLVEEIHVTKRRHETHQDQHITLRKEEVKVSRLDLDNDDQNKV